MVAEADESDRSFLRLSPAIAVITNIDREHLDAYGSFERLAGAFVDFADRVPFYGAVVAGLDDPGLASVVPRLSRRAITYGFVHDADVRGVDPTTDGRTGRCGVEYRVRGLAGGDGAGDLALPVPGRHNLQNALAAVAVGLELGLPFTRIRDALAEFSGAERRYQLKGTVGGVTVIDDYAHHPTEVAAVLAAARAGRPARLIAVFQPHRFSRTRDLLAEFGPALASADLVVLTDIYPAGERPISGAALPDLAAAVEGSVPALHVVPAVDDIPAAVADLVRPGDLVVTLGAGSIGVAAGRLLSRLAEEVTR